MRNILLVILGIVAIFTNLQADERSSRGCFRGYVQPSTKLSFEKFVEKHSFKEWVELNRNDQEGFKEEFKDVFAGEGQECIPNLMSAIFYRATHSKKYKRVATRGKRCYDKKIGRISGVYHNNFSKKYTILEIVDLVDNNATKLLIELQRDGYDIKLRKGFKRKCLIPMMQGLIENAKDSPKIGILN